MGGFPRRHTRPTTSRSQNRRRRPILCSEQAVFGAVCYHLLNSTLWAGFGQPVTDVGLTADQAVAGLSVSEGP